VRGLRVRDLITDLLDAFALLAIAFGIGAGLSPWIGWFGLAVTGVIVLAGSLFAQARTRAAAEGDA
jgi:hypothetical protein